MGKNGHILPGRFKNPEGNWLNKYNDGGAPCPPGYVMNFAGECVPIKTKHSEEVKTYPLGYESIYDHYIGDYIKPDSGTENFLEMIDPSGFASHDDARRAYEQWQKSGNTFPSVSEALDMFSAVPALGKFAYLRYLDPNSIKAAYKQIPWQAILNLMGSEVGEDEEEKKKFGGGLNKYADGGTRPCPEGYLWDEKLQDCVKLYTDLGEYRKANQAFQDSSVLYNFQESMGGRSSNWLKSVKRNADGTVPDKAWKEYSDRAKKVPKRELDSQWKAFNNLTKRNKKEPGKKFYFRQELEGVPGGFDTYVADFEKPTQPVRYVKNPDDENVEIRNYGLILPYYPPEEPIKLNSKQVTRLQGYTTPTTLNPVSLPENLRQEISRAQDKSLSWEDTMKKYSDKYPGMEPIYQMTNNREGVGNQKLMGFTYRDYYDQENPRKFRPKEYRFEQKMGGTTGWLDQYAGGGMGGPLGLNSAQLKTISDYADKLNFQENCEDGNCRETDQIQAIYDEAQRIPGRVADFERGLLEKLWTDPVTGQEKKELQLGNPNDDARNLWKKYGAPNNFPTPSCMYVAGLGYRCFPGTKEYMSKFNTTPFNSNDQFIAAVNNGTLPFKRIDMTTDSTFDQQSKSNLRPGDIVNFKGPDMSHAMTFVGYDDKGKSDWFHSSGAPNVLYLEKDLWKDVRNPNIKKYINRFDEDRYVKEQYGDKIEQLEKQARENPTYYEKGGSTGWLDRYAGGGQGCPDGYIRNWAGQCVPANAQGMTSLTQDVNAYAREQEARAANERKMKEDAARAYNTYTTPGAAQVQVQTKQNLEKEKGYKEAKARAENTGTITKANPQVIASMEKEIDPSKITAWDYAKFYGNVLMDPLNAMKYSNEHGGRDMPIDYFSQQDYNPSLFLSALPAAGLYGAGALTNTGRTVISGANNLGRAAWQAANSPIRNIPGLTPMNLVNLGIGVNSANNLSSDINTGYYGSDAPLAEKILKGVETGLGVLGSPGMGNMLLSGARNIGRGYNTVAKRSGFSLGNNRASTSSGFVDDIIDKANADNFNFYTSEANQQKLRAFRPETTGPILPKEGAPPIYSDFDPAGQEAWATFRNDVLDGKYPNLTKEQKELVSNSPLLSQALGDSAGKWFGSANMGAVQSGLPDEIRYLAGLHESTHGWSQGIGLHPTEAMILRGAYNRGMTGLPSNLSSAEKAEEALATQREIRSLLNDPFGERFYTMADAPEIRRALDKISKSGDYLKNPGAIDMNRLISSLNRIGLGAFTGAGIGLGSYKLYNNSGNNEQGQSYYKKGGVKTSADGYIDYLKGKGSNAYSIFAKGGSKGWLDNYK